MKSRNNHAQRITLVISSLGAGGAERVMVDLCRSLNEAGRDVTLLTLSGDDPDVYQVPAGVHRERMEIRRPASSWFNSIRFSLRHLYDMRRRITSLTPDVVVSFVDQTNVRAIACLLATKVPVVVSERTNPECHQITRPWRWARRLLYPFASNVVVQTKSVEAWVRNSIPNCKVSIIPNAARARGTWSTYSEPATRSGQKYVVGVGRLTREKGFDQLLEAFHRSSLYEGGWKLIVVGDGSEREALSKQVHELGIQDSVEMPGHVDNVAAWLARAEIFVLPSRYEGFPNALIEAMQLGRAVVSFDCPSGPSDLIQHGKNGWLVPAQDVDALAEALRRVANDCNLRLRIGSEAVGVNERLSPKEIYGRWLTLIDEVAVG